VIAVALSVLGLLAGVAGITLAIAANNRADRIIEESGELIRSQFTGTAAAGRVDPRAIRDVALVRYDALKEMAGQLSFSVALLNAAGDGVVLTSINGRSETRTYAKTVAAGKGVQPLSPEEEESVRSARLGNAPPAVPVPGAGAPEMVRFVPGAAARDATVPHRT
jgi:hypothetical protein